LRSDEATEQISRARSMPATRAGSAGKRGGSGQSSGAPSAAGEAAPDLLGDQRQQRGHGAGDHLERGVERVERGLVEGARASPLSQNRSRERRMYQLVSTSRKPRIESQAAAIS
jgi:hypothetical protein